MKSGRADVCQYDIFGWITLQQFNSVNAYTVIAHQQVAQTDDRNTGIFVFMFQLTGSHSMYDCFFAGTDDMCRAVEAGVERMDDSHYFNGLVSVFYRDTEKSFFHSPVQTFTIAR